MQEALNGTRGNAAKSGDLQRDDTGSSGGKRIRKKKSRLGILVAVLIAVVGVQIVLAVVVYPRYARTVTEGIQEGSTGADAKAVSEPVKEAEQPDQETVPEGAQKDSSAETAEILAPEVVESGGVVSLPEIKAPSLSTDSVTLPALLDSIRGSQETGDGSQDTGEGPEGVTRLNGQGPDVCGHR